jgi:hypothetical protein
MPAVQLCAEFALFPDNLQLGPSFSLAGYDFVQPAGGTLMFVNVTGSEKANPANTLFTSVCTLADRVGLAEGL